MTIHEKYILRCLELAKLGAGKVSPNPLVGCVIVNENKIIGEGWHKKFGESHAEVNAIREVKDELMFKQATLYVNLEPCSHFGKTPPCVDLIIEKRIPKVVIGMQDPFKEVAGEGIRKLIDAGVEVQIGILEPACKELNKRFIVYINHQRPFVILKWAQTADGFIAPNKHEMSEDIFEQKRHITGLTIQKWVHKWRSEEDAIMVGTNTIRTDNPSLNVRAWTGRNPLRITIDRNLTLDVQLYKFFDGTQPSIIFTEKTVFPEIPNCTYITIDFEKYLWKQIYSHLHALGIQSIIVEGGSYTINSLINEGIWDEAQIFITPKQLMDGVVAPSFTGIPTQQIQVDHSTLNIYRNV